MAFEIILLDTYVHDTSNDPAISTTRLEYYKSPLVTMESKTSRERKGDYETQNIKTEKVIEQNASRII